MRVAIVGSGISGLVAARRLHGGRRRVDVFEASDHVGGHVNTVDVDDAGELRAIDTAFVVYNERTYPLFTKLLEELGVATKPTSMSFSVRCDRSGLEYNGTSANGIFAQRSNLFRPAFHRMLRDILRFNREAPAFLDVCDETTSIGAYIARNRYSTEFFERYLAPMGSAIWSCGPGRFRDFPARLLIAFYVNHGLLSLRDRPVWRVVEGGSKRYVEALIAPFRDRIRLRTSVRSVRRRSNVVLVDHTHGTETYDEVVFACHSDQALRLLSDPTEAEREILGTFPYEANEAVLHTDVSVMPRRRRAWASWNYHVRADAIDRAVLTYDMNRLQGIESKVRFLVSLNETGAVDESQVLRRFTYHHPIHTTERAHAQARHAELIRANRTSFCGAYWGNGFHEDGVRSATAVCDAFGPTSRWGEESAVEPSMRTTATVC